MFPSPDMQIVLTQAVLADINTVTSWCLGLLAPGSVPGSDLGMVAPIWTSFTGYTQIQIPTAPPAPDLSLDPNTGEWVVTFPPPAGGWRWVAGAYGGIPIPVAGYFLYEGPMGAHFPGDGSSWASYSALLDEPVIITATGQEIIIPAVQFRFNSGGIS